MLERGKGSIVNIGSMSGFIVNKPQPQTLLQRLQGGGASPDQLARGGMGRARACGSMPWRRPISRRRSTRFGIRRTRRCTRPGSRCTPMRRVGQPDEIALGRAVPRLRRRQPADRQHRAGGRRLYLLVGERAHEAQGQGRHRHRRGARHRRRDLRALRRRGRAGRRRRHPGEGGGAPAARRSAAARSAVRARRHQASLHRRHGARRSSPRRAASTSWSTMPPSSTWRRCWRSPRRATTGSSPSM